MIDFKPIFDYLVEKYKNEPRDIAEQGYKKDIQPLLNIMANLSVVRDILQKVVNDIDCLEYKTSGLNELKADLIVSLIKGLQDYTPENIQSTINNAG